MFELHHLTAQEQADWLRRGEVTPTELVAHYLARIDRIDPQLGAFTTVTPDAALARAASLEASGVDARALWALPHAEKDLSARAGVRFTSGSRLFRDRVAAASDPIVAALDDAGVVSLGKTAAPEFGLASYTESRVGRPTETPYGAGLGAGGPSGGAAAAVAAGLLPAAFGSDGGGSVRIPAAATGLVGLKPSRGRIPSSSGLASLAGLVVAGPLARTVADAAMLLDAVVDVPGAWPHATHAPTWDGGALLNAAVRGEGRFQLARTTWSPWSTAVDVELDPDAVRALEIATDALAATGHGIEEFAPAEEPAYPDAFRAIWMASAAGIPAEGAQLDELEPLTRWLVERGRALGARDLAAALGALAAFEQRVVRAFAPYDAVLMPALAMTPRPVGWYDADDGEANFVQQCRYSPYTSFVNVAGLPAIVLPVHTTADGLPMGVQLVGRPGGEHVLLSLGAQLERRIRWHRTHPPQW